MTPPVALTIAGSDSGGAAGIQADLKAFAAHRVYGTVAITAVTAQNTRGVQGVEVLPAAFVDAQITSVTSDLPIAAVKTGMLATTEIVAAVAARAASGDLPGLVVDPVMVASSGDRLLAPEAEAAYIDLLFPHAVVVTPNRLETEILAGRPVTDVASLRDAAKAIAARGPRFVVAKGGDLDPPDAPGQSVDIVVEGDAVHELRAPRVATGNNHGTGCTFAATVAARIAHGDAPVTAIEAAKAYVHEAITGGAAWNLGGGHGPVDHFGWEHP